MVEIEERIGKNHIRYAERNEKTVAKFLEFRKNNALKKINVKASKNMQALKKENM
ncbi:hypothetical protein [Methanobrevibacter filiformis]|uniref:Uncharacterized protein n=1 Tax=Methanobrevibacter filiformis TaxID=55758 RepID=A0A165ZWE1_9EURY|nr:hypothetical protein [Methanobrevibacter filiformis]KZX11253.1 hypothetical protein MBFIL_14910 [Methanobrevibacter filiformis]